MQYHSLKKVDYPAYTTLVWPVHFQATFCAEPYVKVAKSERESTINAEYDSMV